MRISVPKILPVVCAFAAAAVLVRADSISEKRMELLFRPLLGERMAMSTDGHYLAYTQHVEHDLTIVVYDLERMRQATRIIADEDRTIMFSKEKQRAQLRFLGWANGHRLVFAPTVETVRPAVQPPSGEVLASMSPEVREMVASIPKLPTRYIAPVMVVDADGGHPVDLDKTVIHDLLADSNPLVDQREVVPELHGFGTGKYRDQLLVEVRGDAPGIPTDLFRVDVMTGKHTLAYRQFGSGNFIYDRAGQPRLNRFSDRYTLTTTFEYRAPGAKGWIKMPEPPDEDTGASFTLSPGNYFSPRVIPLGFDFDPNVLLYASNVGRDTFGIFGMDLRTRRRTAFALEVAHRDLAALDTTTASSPLVFDSYRETLAGVRANFGPRPLTVWCDGNLAEIQRAVEGRFPQRSVQVLQWNEKRTRFLVRTTGGTDPGSIFLVRRPEGSMTELTRSAPWLADTDLHETRFIEFTAPNGAQLTGHLTLPRNPRLNPPPLVIWFAPGLPPQPHRAFDPQAQVLADMGFVVCRLNQRGVLGLGTGHREALRRDPDHTTADDAIAAIEWIAQRHRIDRNRVVTFGEGFAGHLAVRATQIHPEAFRCAVVIDPIINLASWVQPPANVNASGPPSFAQQINRIFLEGRGARLHELSVTAHADEPNAATFILTRAEQRTAADATVASGVAQLQSQLKRRDIPCIAVEYNEDFTHGLPAARARVYRALEEFLNLNLYNYKVKIGPTRVVP